MVRLWIEQRLDPLQQRFERLPTRDQRALMVLSVFLLVFLLVGGVWWGHVRAKAAQADAQAQRELLAWMKSQAPYLRQDVSTNQPLSGKIEQAARLQGLQPTISGNDQQVQVAVSHENFAVLGSWLSRLVADGVQIKQLEIKKNSNQQLQLQANLSAAN